MFFSHRHIRNFHGEFEKMDEFESSTDYFLQSQDNDEQEIIDVKPDISNIISNEKNQFTEPREGPIVVCPTKTLNLYSCTMVRKFQNIWNAFKKNNLDTSEDAA